MAKHHHRVPAAEVVDPVCGMNIAPQDAVGTHTYKGENYYFCSQSCLERFKESPEQFPNKPAGPGATAQDTAQDKDTDYTCPMDPEVRQKGPGACPKCGMALEPATVAPPQVKVEYTCPMHPEIVRSEPGNCPSCGMALEPRQVVLEEVNPELIHMRRRFWTSFVLTLPLLGVMLAELFPRVINTSFLMGERGAWLQFIFATPVVVWGGWPFFQRGWASIVNRHLNMFTLIAIGTGAALLVQRGRDGCARNLSRVIPRDARWSGRLFRSCRRDRHAGSARPSTGTSRSQPNQWSDKSVAGDGAQNRALDCRGWPRRRHRAGSR